MPLSWSGPVGRGWAPRSLRAPFGFAHGFGELSLTPRFTLRLAPRSLTSGSIAEHTECGACVPPPGQGEELDSARSSGGNRHCSAGVRAPQPISLRLSIETTVTLILATLPRKPYSEHDPV